MTAIGGPIESVSIAGREFPATADADVARGLGGFENEIQMNGDGTGRIIKTPVAWMLDGLTVQVDDTRGDQEFLQGVSDGNDYEAIGVTFASGETYHGRGIIVSELRANNQSASASVSIAGTGKLTRQ